MRLCRLPYALVVLALASSGVRGDVLFSNFGPGDAFGAGAYTVFSTTGPGGVQQQDWIATAFTVGSYSRLAGIEVPVKQGLHAPSTARAYLMTDSGGVPWSVLMSWSFAVPASPGVVNLLAPSSSAVILAPGTRYWVALEDFLPDTTIAWFNNSLGTTGAVADLATGAAWRNNGVTLQPTLRISGASIHTSASPQGTPPAMAPPAPGLPTAPGPVYVTSTPSSCRCGTPAGSTWARFRRGFRRKSCG